MFLCDNLLVCEMSTVWILTLREAALAMERTMDKHTTGLNIGTQEGGYRPQSTKLFMNH